MPRSDMGRSNHRLIYGQNMEGDYVPPTPSSVSTALDAWDNRSDDGTVYRYIMPVRHLMR